MSFIVTICHYMSLHHYNWVLFNNHTISYEKQMSYIKSFTCASLTSTLLLNSVLITYLGICRISFPPILCHSFLNMVNWIPFDQIQTPSRACLPVPQWSGTPAAQVLSLGLVMALEPPAISAHLSTRDSQPKDCTWTPTQLPALCLPAETSKKRYRSPVTLVTPPRFTRTGPSSVYVIC